ncbi:MAG: dTMP kinase [Desulfococcaceae bacterium]
MFITFEGIEGSGKTTQIRAAADWLKNRGINCLCTREPGSTVIGLKIRGILLDPDNRQLDHMAELLLYMADRAQHIADVIRPALAQGKTVLCDRYFDATLAYQGYARGLDRNMLKNLHSLLFDNLQPDLTLLLDLPAETGLHRAWKQISNGERTAAESRFEAEKLAFHEKVRAGYLDMAQKEPERFRIIDASLSPEQVREKIIDILT